MHSLILTQNAEQRQAALARIETVTPQQAVASAIARGVRVDSRMKLLIRGIRLRVREFEGLESGFELPDLD